ncbi:MAG: hypothetical protein ACRDMV_13845 [Streptosporangiales bacterium]
MEGYQVRLLPVGRSEIPGPELFWMSGWQEWYPLTFQVALIQGPGVVALVNTGPADDLDLLNERWSQVLGERALMRRDEGERPLDHLDRLGIAPSQVTHVILTPLQLYTVGNVLAFDEAQICIAERGWVHFHTTHAHPHDDRATSIPDDILVRLVTDAWPRVRLLADEDELAPGLRTWWCGTHHRASIVVEADTPAGTVAVSDAYFYLDNIEQDHPMGITENLYEAMATYRRVREQGLVPVPLYDPGNSGRFPGGKVA